MNFDNDSTNLNSLSLNSFRKFEAACRALKTVRLVTEKKNLLSEIGEFLNDSKIIQILDSLTSGQQLKIEYDKENVPQYSQYSSQQIFIDWNVLFDLLQNFVLTELKTIMDKNFTFSQSQRTASSQNIDNKIYQLRAVSNLVLNQINSRSQINLELSLFLDFFDSIVDLSDDFTTFQAKILNDLSNFLLNQILNNHKYCLELKKPKWIEFLNFFMNNYLNYLSGNISIDPICSTKCLRKILSNVLKYAGLINMTKVFSFLSTVLIEIKKDSNPEVIENLMGCAYELSSNFQNDCLYEVKKFGEEISIKLIDLCDSRIGCVNSKELLIKFLVLQINLHKDSEKNGLTNNALWIEITKSSYEWSRDEIFNNIQQKLINKNFNMPSKKTEMHVLRFKKNVVFCSLTNYLFYIKKFFQSLKTNRSNYQKCSEIEDWLFFVISECWFTLSNRSVSLINKNDISNLNRTEDSPVKKRKIDHNIYSWSFIISQIEHDLDHAASIFWSKFFEKIFNLHGCEIQKEIINYIILKFLNKNLSLLEKKIVSLNEDRIRLHLVINSTLNLLLSVLKNKIEHLDLKVDFWNILNYCFNNRSNSDLILEILKSKPIFIRNLTKNLVSRVDDKIDMFSLEIFSKTNLSSLHVKYKYNLLNLMLSSNFEYLYDLNFTNYLFINEIILRLLGSKIKSLNESLDLKFLFSSNENILPSTQPYCTKINQNEEIVPNLEILKHLVNLLSLTLEQANTKKLTESSLTIVLSALNILSYFDDYELEELEKLKYQCRNFFTVITNDFDLLENVALSVKYFKEIYKVFKNLNSNKAFLLTLGPKIIEISLKVLDSQVESEVHDLDLLYLNDVSRLDYLKMLSMGLICNICVQESSQKIGLNLKKRLFFYLKNLKAKKKEKFFILFLICFNGCKFLDFKEYSICLDWFDDIFAKFEKLPIQTRIFVLGLFRKYFEKILAFSCLNLEENYELDQSQSKYIKIMDTHFLDCGYLVEINLAICEIFGEILKLMRIKNFSKKDILGFFSKFYNQFLGNSNQSIIAQQQAIKTITQACFQDVKAICYRYFNDLNVDKDSIMQYLEKIDQIYSNSNQDLANAFFDRIYMNLVLENKIFESEYSEIVNLRASMERNSKIDEKYSAYKKFFISIKRQMTELVAMKSLVLDFFNQLCELTNDFDNKFIVKSMFGLIQISCEYKAHFDSLTIKNLLRKYPNFEKLKLDLIYQWTEVYITEKDDIKNLNNIIEKKFPFIFFDYKNMTEFFVNHLDQIIAFLLEKFDIKLDNVLFILDIKLTDVQKCKIYGTMIRKALFKESFNLKILFETKVLDLDFIEKNFLEIFEQVFFKVYLPDATEVKLQKCIGNLNELLTDEDNTSKGFYKLLGNKPYSIFKILLNLRRLIESSDLNYSLMFFQIFIKCIILPISETSYDLISNTSECTKFLMNSVLFSFVNFLQMVISKFDALDKTEKDFSLSFYKLTKLSKKFMVKLFNLFMAVIDYVENSFEYYDYAISCVVWYFCDYLNKYPQFEQNMDYMEELNKNIYFNLINFLHKYHKFSPRLTRQVKFLYYQAQFFDDDSSDKLAKYVLMGNLKSYGELNKKHDTFLDYEFLDEMTSVLISVDFNKNLTFKFLLCYAINLILIELSNGGKDMQISKIVMKIMEKLRNYEHKSYEIKKLAGILISKIGPVNAIKAQSVQVKNDFDRMNSFLKNKFKNDSTDSMNSFYFDLYLQLNDLLTDHNLKIQLIGYDMIEMFFTIRETKEFLFAYENFFNEYLVIEKEKQNYNELSRDSNTKLIDQFIELTKLFKYKNEETACQELKKSENSSCLQKIDWNFQKNNYQDWIRNFAENLIQSNIVNDNISTRFLKVFDIKPYICELFILNYIKISIENNAEISYIVGKNISCFFEQNHTKHLNEILSLQKIKAIKFYLKIIDYVKSESILKNENAVFWLNNAQFWNCIDFLTLADFALQVSENFTAIYYVEVWYNKIIYGKKKGFNISNFEIFKSNLRSIEILFECFQKIGEKNALETELVYLVHSSQNYLNFLERDDNEQQLVWFDNYLSQPTENHDTLNTRAGLIKSLRSNGLNFLQNYVVKDHDDENYFTESKYSNSFMLGLWEDYDFKNESITASNFNESLNNLYHPENQKNIFIIDMAILNTQKYLESIFSDLNLDNLLQHQVDVSIIKLYNLEELKKFLIALKNPQNNGYFETILRTLFHYENYEIKYFMGNSNSYSLFDNLLNLRLKSTDIFLKKNVQSSKINDYEENLFEKLIDNSIYFKEFEKGHFYINEMRKTVSSQLKCDLKEAQMQYVKSNLKKAKFILRNSIEKFEASKLNQITERENCSEIKNYIKALDFYGHILNETKSENPNFIIEKILEKSIKYISRFNLENSSENIHLIVESFFSLAKFADSHFQNINDYLNSKSFEEHAELVNKFHIESNKTKIIDPKSHFNMILNKQYNIDREEMENLIENKETYLCKSINYYMNCLELGSDQQQDNYCVFRLVSLWTQNNSNLKVNKTVEEKIFGISSHKFIILIYQLAARMSLKSLKSDQDSNQRLFQSILIALVTKTTQKHPHHCLPILFAFSNSHKDLLLSKSSEEVGNFLKAEDRVNTSNSILEKLKNSDYMIRIIESMSHVCHSYIELANTNISTRPRANEYLSFPKNLLINKIKNFKHTNVITNSMSINSNGCYDDSKLIFIVKFDPRFKVANGVNMPKIVHCLGSDGILRKQLVKGKDDLRQDAVMQQFFSTVNDLIQSNNSSRNTIELNTMRTYKIVPLSQKSGVLEWCLNTITIGDWLIGQNQDGGAHKKYEPKDLKFDECKRILYEASQPNGLKKLNKKSKLEVFLDVISRFKPVFRYFFLESFHDHKEWFERRQNFTKSVATSSIVGYVVGLGDRHVQNILIDTRNADVVHIDLGIAFDQGKILPIPETVPFRLTRDMIDGFGVCAVEGIFKNCCESILELLKKSREQIMTIFEVLLYDPLHNWCLSPAKALMMQQAIEFNNQSQTDIEASIIPTASFDTSNKANCTQQVSKPAEKNKIAERILFQIKQKLLGYENGAQLSTDGQINYLINEATNPENLCRIYVGWQPYL